MNENKTKKRIKQISEPFFFSFHSSDQVLFDPIKYCNICIYIERINIEYVLLHLIYIDAIALVNPLGGNDEMRRPKIKFLFICVSVYVMSHFAIILCIFEVHAQKTNHDL